MDHMCQVGRAVMLSLSPGDAGAAAQSWSRWPRRWWTATTGGEAWGEGQGRLLPGQSACQGRVLARRTKAPGQSAYQGSIPKCQGKVSARVKCHLAKNGCAKDECQGVVVSVIPKL